MQTRLHIRECLIIVVLGITLAISLNLSLLLIDLPQYSKSYQDVAQTLYTPTLLLQVLCAGICVPVLEELIFRGVLFLHLRKRISFPYAMILSALVFGIYHGNLVQFVYAGIAGLVLALLCEKYGILSSILVHISMNLTSIIATKTGALSWALKDTMRAVCLMMINVIVCALVLCMLQNMDVTKMLKKHCKHTCDEL